MIVKSGLEKIFLKFLHAGTHFWTSFIYFTKRGIMPKKAKKPNLVPKITSFPHGGISTIFNFELVNEG